jgi:predicted phage gp36 major capsid-like protein
MPKRETTEKRKERRENKENAVAVKKTEKEAGKKKEIEKDTKSPTTTPLSEKKPAFSADIRNAHTNARTHKTFELRLRLYVCVRVFASH